MHPQLGDTLRQGTTEIPFNWLIGFDRKRKQLCRVDALTWGVVTDKGGRPWPCDIS
jgi:hypothetical protein